MTSTEVRLRRLEDIEEIRRLIQAYRRHLDRLDLVSYGQLFAADGEWIGGTGYGKSPAGITEMRPSSVISISYSFLMTRPSSFDVTLDNRE